MEMAIDPMVQSTSVEVIATVGMDGSIRTRSVLFPESSLPITSLVDTHENAAKELNGSRKQPELVSVGSNSDSEDCSVSAGSADGNSNKVTSHVIVLQKGSSSTMDIALHKGGTVTSSEDGAVGMYDCLSDQITNLFCPVEHPANLCLQPPATPNTAPRAVAENQITTVSCTGGGCTEYEFQDFFGSQKGGDVFSSLQFWLTPSQEEEMKGTTRRQPHNRSSSNRKRRSKHIREIWDSWHSQASIPLEHSKSLPTELRQRCLSEAEDECLKDVCYDSDPEQEYVQNTQRGEQLLNPSRPSGTFRDYKPETVKTIPEDKDCYLRDCKVPSTPRNSDCTTPRDPLFTFSPRRRDSFDRPYRRKVQRRPFDTPIGPTDYDLMNPEGDYILRSFIQEATNTRIPLVWHRRTKGVSGATKRRVPISVSCAFEVGAHLDNLVVQPKFTWSPTYEPHLPFRRIHLSGTEPDSIELLSIIRVVKPAQLNRNLYPFARLDRTCCITTNDEEFPYLVFEAPSTRERDWLVNAMKMIVARLASIIIVRDETMLLEFFTPYAALMHLDPPPPPPRTSSSKIKAPSSEEKVQGSVRDPAPTKPALDTNGELQLISYGRK